MQALTLKTFYKSKQWEGLIASLRAERVNEQGFVVCAKCGKPILRKYDCIGHHVIELTDDNVNDLSISLNPENIQLIHFRCHNEIHERYEGYRQRVFLVYGSPCSGKTSWVHSVAHGDDLVLDIDKLWQAVSVDGAKKPNRLKANVFGLRDCLLDMIRTRAGKWRNAYVIGGYPLKTDRDRLCDMLGASPVYIEATKEECLERARAERPAGWERYVEDWFESYTQ